MPITIHLRHFAVIREMTGTTAEDVTLGDDATVAELQANLIGRYPGLSSIGRSAVPMVNHGYAKPETRLNDGDEVAFIPPVAGGAPVRLFDVTSDVLDARRTESAVRDSSCGAIVTFVGEVRDVARGESVTALDYEAYAEAAVVQMNVIADEIVEKIGVDRIAIIHRTGLLQPGDASVVISVASPHRAEAFEAARHAIERLKELVPIWKKEHYADGSVWIGSEADYQRDPRRR